MKNIDGFNFAKTFLNVKSLDFILAALTPNSLKDFTKFLELFLLPLLTIFFFVDNTFDGLNILALLSLFPFRNFEWEGPSLPKPSEKPSPHHLYHNI